jgi:hypothetical protein
MIKIDAAKIASHKTDKCPQFLAKEARFPARLGCPYCGQDGV